MSIATYCSPGEDIWHNGAKIAKQQWLCTMVLYALRNQWYHCSLQTNIFRLHGLISGFFCKNGTWNFCRVLSTTNFDTSRRMKEKSPWGQGLLSRTELVAFLGGRPGMLTFPLYCDRFNNKTQQYFDCIYQWSFVLPSLDQPSRTDWEIYQKGWVLACSVL